MSLSWTSDGRLAQVMEGTVSRFTASYAGDGERVQKTDTTGTRTYHWGMQETGDREEDTRSYASFRSFPIPSVLSRPFRPFLPETLTP